MSTKNTEVPKTKKKTKKTDNNNNNNNIKHVHKGC